VKRVWLILFCASVVVAGGSLQPAAALADTPPSAAALEGQLVCPTCKETLDESDSPVARRMKVYIRRRIAEGATGDQIKTELVGQFGKGVLATPPTKGFGLLAWVLPIGGAALVAVVLGFAAWTWSRRRDGSDDDEPLDPDLDPELERRLDDALAQFED
jgi:cytochrome c-type biogenesis protein CcmH